MSTSNNYPSPPVARSSDDGLSTVLTFLRRLASDRYFGRVEFSFQSGHVVNIRQEQSMKVGDLSNLVANSKGSSNVDSSR